MPTPEDEEIRHWLHVIGQRIQTAREAAGLSRTRFARQLGSTPGTLFRIEQGTHPRVAVHFLAVIADELGLRFTDLMARAAAVQDSPEVTPGPRMPRFSLPVLSLPALPDLPTAGTRLTTAQVQEIYDHLMQCGVQAFTSIRRLVDAWEAHYTQHGRPAPPLHDRGRRRPRRRDPDA